MPGRAAAAQDVGRTTGTSTDHATASSPLDPNAPEPTVVPLRHPGRWVLGAVVGIVAVWLVWAFATADIDYSVTVDYLTARPILEGVWHTLELTLTSMAIALAIGVLIAVMRQSQNPVLRVVAAAWAWLFRGIPLLVQLLIWFNLSLVFQDLGIPGVFTVPTNDVMTPFVAALIGLSINESAYISEIVRGGILSVDNGQREAASALGMQRGRLMRRIVLPQAMRVIVPPLGNEFISLLKYSSLAYTISYSELLLSANKIYTANFLVVELLFTASIWYLLLTTVFTLVQQQIERRLSRGVPGSRPPERLSTRWRRNLSLRRAAA
jgi:polar amino acid transport system permease protein